jgi:hypothetical protein
LEWRFTSGLLAYDRFGIKKCPALLSAGEDRTRSAWRARKSAAQPASSSAVRITYSALSMSRSLPPIQGSRSSHHNLALVPTPDTQRS